MTDIKASYLAMEMTTLVTEMVNLEQTSEEARGNGRPGHGCQATTGMGRHSHCEEREKQSVWARERQALLKLAMRLHGPSFKNRCDMVSNHLEKITDKQNENSSA